MSSWYDRNREKAIKYQKEYNKEHREEYLAYQGAYYYEVEKPKRQGKPDEVLEKPLQIDLPAKLPKQPKPPKQKTESMTKNKKRFTPYEPKIMITRGNYILTFD